MAYRSIELSSDEMMTLYHCIEGMVSLINENIGTCAYEPGSKDLATALEESEILVGIQCKVAELLKLNKEWPES